MRRLTKTLPRLYAMAIRWFYLLPCQKLVDTWRASSGLWLESSGAVYITRLLSTWSTTKLESSKHLMHISAAQESVYHMHKEQAEISIPNPLLCQTNKCRFVSIAWYSLGSVWSDFATRLTVEIVRGAIVQCLALAVSSTTVVQYYARLKSLVEFKYTWFQYFLGTRSTIQARSTKKLFFWKYGGLEFRHPQLILDLCCHENTVRICSERHMLFWQVSNSCFSVKPSVTQSSANSLETLVLLSICCRANVKTASTPACDGSHFQSDSELHSPVYAEQRSAVHCISSMLSSLSTPFRRSSGVPSVGQLVTGLSFWFSNLFLIRSACS